MKKIERDKRRRQKARREDDQRRWNATHPTEAEYQRDMNRARKKKRLGEERVRTLRKIVKKRIQRLKSQWRKRLIEEEDYQKELKVLQTEQTRLK